MTDPLIGRLIGNYKIEEQLGEGGMGAVYKAVHTEIESVAAIKVLGLGRNAPEKERVRFLNEAKALGALRHTNILQVFDFIYQDGIYYMLMEYVDGRTLQDMLQERGGPLPLAQTARILAQVARALDFAHNRGIIHRDIKPSNILIDEDERVVLSDFGIAKLTEATTMDLTQDGATIGTPAYMSPEQAKALEVGQGSDIYSLGVVLYEIITGCPPFSGSSPIEVISKHVNHEPPSLRSINQNLTKRQEKVILKALEKEPDDRYARAGDLSQAFLATISNVSEISLETGSKWERFREGRAWGTLLRIGRGIRGLSLGFVGLLSRSIFSIILGSVIVIIALLIGASMLLGNALENAIATGDWGFEDMGLGSREELSPEEFVGGIEAGLDQIIPGTVTDIWLLTDASGKAWLNGAVAGAQIQLEVEVMLEEGFPTFKIGSLNGYYLPIVGGLVARGINDGFQRALTDANASISSLEMDSEQIVVVIDGPAAQTTKVDSRRCDEGVHLWDDFSDIYSGWTQSFDTSQAGVGYKAGGYSLWTAVPNIIITQALPCRFQDFDASIEAQADGDPGDASWGLVFYEVDPDHYWVFQINALGWYSLERVDAGEHSFVIGWTESEAIKTSDVNILEVLVQEQGELWANGEKIDTFEIPPEARPMGGGSFGMMLRSGEQADVEIIFDNIEVTLPE